MSKKENRFIMHYDYESRKRVFRLNGRDVTVEIERLLEAHEKEIVSTKCKLFQLDMTIQQRLQNQLALTEKALELACEDIDCDVCPLDETICASVLGTEDGCAKAIAKCYLEEAKEMMKSE